jgi:phage gpG-like protein
MDGIGLSVEIQGGDKIVDKLDKVALTAKNPRKSAQASAEWMAGETFRIFSGAYNVDGPWDGLSKMTIFIRRHRANYPRTGTQPGSDTGRLKGSFIPDFDTDGKQFGTGTNVEYAEDFNNGGPSKANVVAIAGFTRRRPGAVYGLVGGKRVGGAPVRVKAFLLHMKAGNPVPARQFFPKGMGEFETWGYLDKVRQIFALDFKETLGGTA